MIHWSLRRYLHRARRALAREPTPGRIRRDMASFDRLMKGRGRFTLSESVDLGTCNATWLDGGGIVAGRVILYLHGGAFVGESPATHCAMLARLCRRAQARGFYVTYRLAPEHRYPAATDDCLAAYRYLLEQGIDPARIVVAGDSAGGNLALVTLLRARDAGMPMPAGLVMISPLLDASFSGASMQRNDGLDPLFRTAIVHALASSYVDEGQRGHPYVSPLWADLRGLPPSLTLVGSSEILLDDSVRFAGLAAGAELQVWHDMPHAFPLFSVLAEATAAVDSIGQFIRRHAQAATANNAASSGAG